MSLARRRAAHQAASLDWSQDMTTLQERIALAVDRDVDERAARQIAETATGLELRILAEQKRAEWLASLRAMALPNEDAGEIQKRLISLTSEPWLLDAIEHDWDDLALYGVPNSPDLPRHILPGTIGLLIEIARSPWSRWDSQGQLHLCRVIDVDRRHARYLPPSASTTGHRILPTFSRFGSGLASTTPIWLLFGARS